MPPDPNNNQLGLDDTDTAGTNAPVSFQDNSNFAANPVDSKKTVKPPKSGGAFSMPKLTDGFAGVKSDLKNQAIGGGLQYASDKLREKQQDDGFQKKYGIAGDIASKALEKAQKKHGENGGLKMSDAGQIAKQAAIETGKERLKGAAVKRLGEQLSKHPELASDIGKLAEGLGTKRLDLTGRKADQLIDEGVQKFAKKGLESVAKAGAKNAAKAGSSALANQLLPGVGAISATDAVHGVGRGLKQLKEGHAIRGAVTAYKGVAKSALITTFNFCIQWEIIGVSIGLSLLVALPVGNILLFTNSRGFTFDKKLLVIATDILLFFFVIICVLGVVVMMCSGLNGAGLALKLASYVSDSANSANEVCKTFSIFNVLSGGFGK